MEANNYPFRGTLQPGPYSVGFRNTFIYDYARSYHLQVQEGETPPSHRMPRPLLVNIWYPASVPAEGNPMRLGEYFDMPSGFPDLEGFSKALGRFHVQEAAIYLVGDPLSEDPSYALDQAELDTYEEIKATPTAAFRDAEPAEGSSRSSSITQESTGRSRTTRSYASTWRVTATSWSVARTNPRTVVRSASTRIWRGPSRTSIASSTPCGVNPMSTSTVSGLSDTATEPRLDSPIGR